MPLSMSLLIGALLSVGAVVSIVWVVDWLREGRDAEEATRDSIRRIGGLVTGIAAVGMVIVVEISMIIGELGALLFGAPGWTASVLISMLGYLTISDFVGLTPETWGILTVIIMTGVLLAAGRRR